jgi:suppressor of ftsI
MSARTVIRWTMFLQYPLHNRFYSAAVAIVAFCAPAMVPAPLVGQASGGFCGAEPLPAWAPDTDLHCIVLDPRPVAPAGRGMVELRPAPSPFGVAVTPEGVHEWEAVVTVEGLPDPADIDPEATRYVAWAADPAFATAIRLGEVREGEALTGAIALDAFRVVVTAEPPGDPDWWAGPVVLRGTSAAMRMVPHEVPWLLLPRDDHAHHHPHPAGDDARWRMPPMHPQVPMPPGMGALTPLVAPLAPDTAGAVDLRPTEVIRLADGDSITLTAGPVRQRMDGGTRYLLGYDGQVPGPRLEAEEGSEVTVRIENRMALPTTVHWHGLRLDNRFDGVPGVTQHPIAPGDGFTYRLRLPDSGVFWYHPHVREDATQGLGLYGGIRVMPRDGGELGQVHREVHWMLDDLLLYEDGSSVPFGAEAPTHALMGRFGNRMLVNGREGAVLEVDRDETVRFALTNTAATRVFNVDFGRPVRVLASDLSPFERVVEARSVVIAPAERYVVEATFAEPGEHAVVNRVRGIDHLYGSFFPEMDTLAVVRVRGERAAPLPGAPAFTGDPELSAGGAALRTELERLPTHELNLSMEAGDLPFPLRPLMQLDSAYFHPVEWSGTMPMMNWVTTPAEIRWILRDPATGRENMEIDWAFRVGDRIRLRIRNEREVLHAMHHPIHIHGQRFLVLALNGVPNENLVWKDTFLLPVGWTADLLVEMSNPGDWMIHCHISEHLESGMMATFRVHPEQGDWEGWEGFEPGTGAPHGHP